MKEIWKDIKGYEGLYQVSNLGRVRSLPRNGTVKEIRLLKQHVKNSGYYIVILSKNNNVDNLEWCTQKYNINYGHCRRKMSLNHSHVGRKGKAINQFDKNMNLINTFDSITDAGEKTKINYRNIGMCCRNQRKTAGNYIWKYAI